MHNTVLSQKEDWREWWWLYALFVEEWLSFVSCFTHPSPRHFLWSSTLPPIDCPTRVLCRRPYIPFAAPIRSVLPPPPHPQAGAPQLHTPDSAETSWTCDDDAPLREDNNVGATGPKQLLRRSSTRCSRSRNAAPVEMWTRGSSYFRQGK